MLVAIAIYVLAHVGVLSAPPVIINVLAIGAVVEEAVVANSVRQDCKIVDRYERSIER